MTLKRTYPDHLECVRNSDMTEGNNLRPDFSRSTLQIYTESTPKAKNGGFKRTDSNMHKQTRTAGTNCSGSTFSETGVISQSSVGAYCTSVYKKEKKRTSTMNSRTYLHFCFKHLERERKSLPVEIHLQIQKVHKQRFLLLPLRESGP